MSTMREIMQQALVFLNEETVQKTANVSVVVTHPAKQQQVFGVLFLVPKSDVYINGDEYIHPRSSSIVVYNEINENG
ncbi:hypothetical protein MNBD_BACTEROID04-1996 [hydrothermal vent metagenome]|uniref:Uncharacterized protein n=1 Tax=hydrothermal vent metagenome TaxID=652676 RepID=A0A3B0UL36_9ZZZZ